MKLIDRVLRRSKESDSDRKARELGERQRDARARLKMLEAQTRITLRRR